MAEITMTATFEDDSNRILKFIKKNSNAMAEEINYQLAHEQLIRAKQIAKDAVDAFYADYPVNTYHRRNDLYNAYDIGIRNNEDFIFILGPDLMSGHHQGPEFVYENSFVRGYHGGSAGTNREGKTVSSPWWKSPPAFIDWYSPAEQAKESPHDRIVREWNAFIDGEYDGIKSQTINNVMSKYAALFLRG